MVFNKNNIKEKYMEYQMLSQQFQQLQENVSALEKHIFDLRSLQENVEFMSKVDVNKETLMPLGSGIFIKGELKDNKSVIMNVGAGVCVEKSINDAKDTINVQLEEVSGVLAQMQQEISNTSDKLNTLQNEFKNLREEELN